MTSPPCQSFSLAGKRKGEDSENGILFYNSQEFIVKNKPRYFIFENVKGLLSDNKGRTFQTWIDMLGGKSVNGNPVLFPCENSTPYHIYHKVLNAKKYGVPQNRERVFIIGIRDNQDNKFTWPKEQVLTKRLKDILEQEVDEKYYLSTKLLTGFLEHKKRHEERGNGFGFSTNDINKHSRAINTKEGTRHCDNYIKVKSATKQGFETATPGDSTNFSQPSSQPSSQTRRGRVGKGVAQTLDTACNQAVIQLNKSKESGDQQPYQQNRIFDINGISPAVLANLGGDRNHNINTNKIRRLTPRECFRLMDFPESFKWSVSDTQAYKQAGNSIVVNVLAEIIKKLQF